MPLHSFQYSKSQTHQLFVLFACFLVIYISCIPTHSSENTDPEYQKLEGIAKSMCSSCHSYVAPDMLDNSSWKRVLSVMQVEMKKLDMEVDPEKWVEVYQFYMSYSPKFLSSPTVSNPPIQSNLFEQHVINIQNIKPSATLLHFDTTQHLISLGMVDGQVFTYQNDLLQDIYQIENIPIDILNAENQYILGMGTIGPSNTKKGKVYKRSIDQTWELIIDSLIRPIHISAFPMSDQEGGEALLVSSFGSTVDKIATGNLSLFRPDSDQWRKESIDLLPGAVGSQIADLNHDGYLDIIALFAQGNESIKVYYNDGGDGFRAEALINLPPVYGSNSFELTDFNDDGHLDIILTCGDNDDYSQVFKSYHGVRIYLNDGNAKFHESYFYPINGAAKVRTHDFDQDGDQDFAVLSMYPDLFTRPYEKLLYFENTSSTKNLNFNISFLESTAKANWILMDIGDVDMDGKMDLIVGANISIRGILPPELISSWNQTKLNFSIFYNK